ncbi:MAG: CBS domain-containing protein [Candidatus Omnitrophica bacterium]|nr:CBS domain-containing protein [Candidatus Omnitrophota bacterium]
MNTSELAKIQIHEEETVKAAMRQMDRVALKILFVVDKDNRLLGTVTNGDFRRWVLAGKKIDEKITDLFNRKPVKFRDGYDIEEVKRVMVGDRIEAVPIVDKNNKLVDVLFWEDIFGNRYRRVEHKLDLPVAIMAGGVGSRLAPFTKILPKPLIPVDDKPVIEVIMDNFAEFGCNKFHLLLGYKGAMVRSYFDNANNSYEPIYYFEDEPEGTAGALKLLGSSNIKGSFFVTNCDIIIKADYSDIYNFHTNNDCDITVVGAMRHFVVPYGVLETRTGGDIDNVIEKPEYDFFVNTGMYIVKKELLSLIPAKEVFHFTDLIKKAQEQGKKIAVYPISEKSWQDIGQWEEYKKTF